MAKTERETLSRFVDRVMKEKGLSQRKVEERSGGAIKASYVGSIARGVARNPSTDKLRALAKGLGVEENALFEVTRGESVNMRAAYLRLGAEEVKRAAGIVEWVATIPELSDSLEMLMTFGDEEQRAIISSIKRMVEKVRV